MQSRDLILNPGIEKFEIRGSCFEIRLTDRLVVILVSLIDLLHPLDTV